MRRAHPLLPSLDPATPEPGEPTVNELYAEHWRYVRALLLSYGVHPQDVSDVSQTVWLHVHRRWSSYEPQRHATRRAWITGFVHRCAMNHHRTQRRCGLTPIEDPDALVLAPSLDPEQAAILQDIHRLIPKQEDRVALLLQLRHGLSIAEIAAVQGVSESVVERRLTMARKELEGGGEKKRSGAFLGFGSLEALADALKPRPIPDEVGAAEWKRIAERIRQEEAAPGDDQDAPEGGEGAPGDAAPLPSSSPPVSASPAMAPPTGPTVLLGPVKLAGMLVLACIAGSIGLLARGAGGDEKPLPAMESRPPSDLVTPAGSTSTHPSNPSVGAPPGALATSTRPAAPGSPVTTRTAAPIPPATSRAGVAHTVSTDPVQAPSNEPESLRMLAQMREAMLAGRHSVVIALAEQHARQFGASHVRAREALRIEALRRTGRTADVDGHARAVLAAHPEHRRALERAAGHALR